MNYLWKYYNHLLLALWILFCFFISFNVSLAFHCFYTHLVVDVDTYIHNIWNGNLCKRADILFIIYQRNAKKNHILHSKSKGKHQTSTIIPTNKLKSIEHFITQNSEPCFVLIPFLFWLHGFLLFFCCQSIQFAILKVRCIPISGKIGLTASFVYLQAWMTCGRFSHSNRILSIFHFPPSPPVYFSALCEYDFSRRFFTWMNNFSQWKSLAYQMSCKSNDELMRIILVCDTIDIFVLIESNCLIFFWRFRLLAIDGEGQKRSERETRLFKAQQKWIFANLSACKLFSTLSRMLMAIEQNK